MDPDAIISLQKHTIDGLRADLARVTAERDRTIGVKDRAVLSAAENKQEADDLRAHIADLEAAASLHWITEEELKQSRAHVAELRAALRDTVAILEEWHTDRPDDVGAEEPAILSAAIAARKQEVSRE